MKTKLHFQLILLMFFAVVHQVAAQGTAFTYQGQLQNNGAPANGSYDLQFALCTTNQFGSPATPVLTNAAVTVNNGLFTTTLDFGAGVFTGTNYWLDISVRTNGSGTFAELSPRQPITPTPYAITAANLSGVVENNSIQSGVSLATISGGSGNAIQTGANDSTIGGGVNNNIGTNSSIATIGGGANNNIGTNDDTSTIAGGNSNIIQDNAGVSTIAGGVGNQIQTDSPRSTISGGSDNHILNNSEHSTIAGGGGNQILSASTYSVIGGGQGNTIQVNTFSSTIGGGNQNTIQTNDNSSTIAGGDVNTIENDSVASTIGGGIANTIETNDQASIIGGGQANTVGVNADFSTIGGGSDNFGGAPFSFVGGGENNTANGSNGTVGGGFRNTATNAATTVGGGADNTASGQNATVSGGIGNTAGGTNASVNGGFQNMASGFAATVPGGELNTASGNFSFAAGREAQATNNGSFVWADSQFPLGVLFSSTSSNQFLIRAGGGVGINMNNPNGASLYVQGSRSGGTFNNSVGFFENTSTATGSAGSGPALRVVCDGGSTPAGALSVSDNGTGPIAQFGNGLQFVAFIQNDGTITNLGNISTAANVFAHNMMLTSDRNTKENFAALDGKAVLQKVVAMPVTEWNYKADSNGVQHIGPMAQDFHAAFQLDGADDKHISVVDEGGVALAAIQGLNQKLDEKDSEIQTLKQQNDSLAERLNELEATVKQFTAQK
jgi:hypothetical protein